VTARDDTAAEKLVDRVTFRKRGAFVLEKHTVHDGIAMGIEVFGDPLPVQCGDPLSADRP
jgi:hypothetical protein